MQYSYQTLIEFMETQIPFNRLIGLKVEHIERGKVVLKVPFFSQAIGDPFRPALHGGLLSTLADTAGGLAVFTQVQDHQVVSTLDLRIDYLRPGQINCDLFGSSKVLRLGKRVGVTQTTLYHNDIDQPVAIATAAYTVVESKGLEQV